MECTECNLIMCVWTMYHLYSDHAHFHLLWHEIDTKHSIGARAFTSILPTLPNLLGYSSLKTRHYSCEKRDNNGTHNLLLSRTVVLFIVIQGYGQELFPLDMYGQADSVGDGRSVKVLYHFVISAHFLWPVGQYTVHVRCRRCATAANPPGFH